MEASHPINSAKFTNAIAYLKVVTKGVNEASVSVINHQRNQGIFNILTEALE